MTKTKLTKKAQEFIITNKELSNRQLQIVLDKNLGIQTSHVAIGTFKKKHLTNTIPTPDISKKDIQVQTPKDRILEKMKGPEKMSFSEFMAKMEQSNSYSAKLLKQKLNVKGKSRQINLDRVLRIIQYTVDILQE